MYEPHFGLQRNPFALTPDPDLLFLTRAHREALAALHYAVTRRKGFLVLVGEVGTGKTTLLRKLLSTLTSAEAETSLIFNPKLTPSEFLETILTEFDLPAPASKNQRLAILEAFLTETHAKGKAAVLIIDEAHQLSPELLEEIRLLSNFETAQQKLLQVILAGQVELDELLCRTDLRQFKQRVSVRAPIRPLSAIEIEQYLLFRWTKAGGSAPLPFTAAAIAAITQWSRGVPRLINSICDNALLLACGSGLHSVDAKHILEVATDLDLRPSVARVASKRPITHASRPSQPPTPATEPHPLPRLERYMPVASKQSLFFRVASKLGF